MSGRVVWDGRWVGHNGIARHAQEVARRLTGCYEILRPGRVSPTSPVDPLYLRGVLRLGAGDLFVSPGFNASLSGRHKQLITVHDLIHLHVDDESSFAKRLYYERVVLSAIHAAGRVLTGSQFSRNEIIAWSGMPSEAVIAVGYGCSFAPATSVEIDSGAAAETPTILFVGNSKPHKNLTLLISALRHLSEDIRVVTVGVPAGHLAKECEAQGVDLARTLALQRISDDELRDLYVKAACVALPSTYEGFGLAALEGMAVGTPTAYCCDAVGEVLGELGFRSDPYDSEAYANVLAEAMDRKRWLARPLSERALKFNWSDVASKVESEIVGFNLLQRSSGGMR